jgi:hypothetical protein
LARLPISNSEFNDKEMSMRMPRTSLCLLALLLLPACAEMDTEPSSSSDAAPRSVTGPPPPAQPGVPIASFTQITGHWEGSMSPDPASSTQDWVRGEIWDDGVYEFASYREMGLFQGRGRLTLRNGQALDRSGDGLLTITLFEAGDKQTLRAVGVVKKGTEYTVNLIQPNPKPKPKPEVDEDDEEKAKAEKAKQAPKAKAKSKP